MTPTDDLEKAAFVAGFSVSTEGFNGEWGPPDEWIEHFFAQWKYGTPLPDSCGYRVGNEPKSLVNDPRCSRPIGHEGSHWSTFVGNFP